MGYYKNKMIEEEKYCQHCGQYAEKFKQVRVCESPKDYVIERWCLNCVQDEEENGWAV